MGKILLYTAETLYHRNKVHLLVRAFKRKAAVLEIQKDGKFG